ncbi:MAG: serine acetyltransferase [Bacteroidaceae bacterium]|nr:serine acetyltransferase [Bacteroidaceae bacterium]
MQPKFILPTSADIDLMMHEVASVLFPEVFGAIGDSDFYGLLVRHICFAFSTQEQKAEGTSPDAEAVASQLVGQLPLIGNLLRSDIDAVVTNDPAVTSPLEVISCYPAFTAMLHYRVAHALHKLGVPLLPRIITERAHSVTGIDIHPAAEIGAAFGIDHGTGIVIGATAIIGTGVMVYQGVTLGAKHFTRDVAGRMIDEPRHPIVEDHVTIYSNTSLLGRIRIGHDSVIGGNLWITHDVPAYSHVRQSRPIHHIGFMDGDGI